MVQRAVFLLCLCVAFVFLLVSVLLFVFVKVSERQIAKIKLSSRTGKSASRGIYFVTCLAKLRILLALLIIMHNLWQQRSHRTRRTLRLDSHLLSRSFALPTAN